MSNKGKIKLLVDAAMYALMLFLLSYPLTRGLMRHGICGCILIFLFICHHFLNAGWYRSLVKRRWNFRKMVLACVDTLLLIAVLALIASSLALAGEIFPFIPFPMTWWGRDLHNTATAWTFALASFHLGLHGQGCWKKLWQILGRGKNLTALALTATGGAACIESGLCQDMLLYGEVHPSPANIPAFFMEYLGTTLFFCLLAQGICKWEKAQKVRQ